MSVKHIFLVLTALVIITGLYPLSKGDYWWAGFHFVIGGINLGLYFYYQNILKKEGKEE